MGVHNAESKDTKLVSFLIDDVLAVDAGSFASELSFFRTGENQSQSDFAVS